MSAVAIATRLREAPVRIAVSTEGRALAALGGLCVLLAGLTWGTWGNVVSDTGYDVVAGARFADGQIPYVDFPYYYGPLAPALHALFAAIGGPGLTPAIVLGLLLAAAIVGATYALARLVVGPLGAFLAAALTAPVAFGANNFSFVLPHSTSATAGMLALLAFLIGLGRFAASGDRRWLVGAGIAAGLVALTRPEFVLAVALGGIVWLVLRVRAGSRLREVALLVGPALLIPAVVYGAFLTAISPHKLILENLYPVDVLRAGGNTLLRSHAPLTASSFGHLVLKLALYAAGAAVLVLLAHQLSGRRAARRGALALLALGGAVAVAGSFLRSETLRYALEYVYGWLPAGAIVAVIVLALRARRGRLAETPAGSVAIVGAIAFAVVAVKDYAAFFIHAPHAQMAVYAMPLAAIFLARLHLVELARKPAAATLGALWLAFLAAAGVGLTLKDAHAESAVVRGPGGAIAARPAEATVYRQALQWILAGSEPGKPVLIAPQLTWMYSISERTDPLGPIALLPGSLLTPRDERAAIARLEAVDLRLAVIDKRSFPEYGRGSFGTSFDTVLAGWLKKKFVRAQTLHAGPGSPMLEVWIRRAS